MPAPPLAILAYTAFIKFNLFQIDLYSVKVIGCIKNLDVSLCVQQVYQSRLGLLKVSGVEGKGAHLQL